MLQYRCGLAPDNNGPGNDYIATIDANPVSTTFGQVVNTADSPYKGTQAHHIGVDVAQNVSHKSTHARAGDTVTCVQALVLQILAPVHIQCLSQRLVPSLHTWMQQV